MQPLQFLSSSLRLEFPQLENLGHAELLRLLSFENSGVRGLTLNAVPESRTLLLCTGFAAQRGRSVDETENLAIDVPSLLRFAKLLEDRISRSSIDGKFSYELYHSQFISVGSGRNRYIRNARSIFQGSTNRVFGQLQTLLKTDYTAQTHDDSSRRGRWPDRHDCSFNVANDGASG